VGCIAFSGCNKINRPLENCLNPKSKKTSLVILLRVSKLNNAAQSLLENSTSDSSIIGFISSETCAA
jgi:siroheme synthase